MDKNKINSYISDYLLNNALSIFKYEGLPDNVKAVDLEKIYSDLVKFFSPNGMTNFIFFLTLTPESRII